MPGASLGGHLLFRSHGQDCATPRAGGPVAIRERIPEMVKKPEAVANTVANRLPSWRRLAKCGGVAGKHFLTIRLVELA